MMQDSFFALAYSKFIDQKLPEILSMYKNIGREKLEKLETLALEFAQAYFTGMEEVHKERRKYENGNPGEEEISNFIEFFESARARWEGQACVFYTRLRMDRGFTADYQASGFGLIENTARDKDVLDLDPNISEKILGSMIKRARLVAQNVYKAAPIPTERSMTTRLG